MPSGGRAATFGVLLRRHRAASGLSQEALSARSGLSVDAISMLERGVRSTPRNSTLVRLADALRLKLSERDAFIAAGQPPADPAAAPRMRSPDTGVHPAPARVASFLGREAELAELRRRLSSAGHLAVAGPPGVGKTQLAARYVEEHGAEYPDGVFWVRADRESTLLGDLAGMAWRLGLHEREHPEEERQVEAVVRWLQERRRWLLVLDDLEPETAATGRRWLPPGLLGHVLEISRAPAWPSHLDLEPLPLDQARRLLVERTDRAQGEAADAVAETLGRLPLALQLAAAHVEASGCDLASYADRLSPHLAAGPVDDHVVAAAVRLSIERLEAERPAAAALLRLCAFLAPDDIPAGIFGPAADQHAAVPASRVELDRAAAALGRYALVENTGESLRVHRVVQSVVARGLGPDEWEAWLGAAIRLLLARFPRESAVHPRRWPLCARLVPHVDALDRSAADRLVEPQAMCELLGLAAEYLQARGELRLAQPLVERALAIRDHVLGPEHRDTRESLDRLVLLLHGRGQLAASGAVLRRALTLALETSESSPRVREVLSAGLASLLDADVDRVYPSRADALPDVARDLRWAGRVGLFASRGNELQRETFEHVLLKRAPERSVTFRVLLPVTRGGDAATYWMRAREAEMGSFDPSFRRGMLAAQVEANVLFLRPYVEVGAVELRRYNLPHLGRVLLTESCGYLTLYRSDAPGRDSLVVKYRRGPTYDWLSRFFDMIWDSSTELEPSGVQP